MLTFRECMEDLVIQVILDQMDLLDRLEAQEVREHKVPRDRRVLKGLMEYLEILVMMDLK